MDICVAYRKNKLWELISAADTMSKSMKRKQEMAMSILSGLAKMGLGRFESAELFEKEEPPKKEVVEEVKKKIDERDYILEKTFECPVCFKSFKDSKVKANKARLIRQDKDLRPVYADIDKGKYDITSCPYCGYSVFEWMPTQFFAFQSCT